MSNTISSPAYPIDYSGSNASNLIPGELQALTGGSGHNFYFIVPDFAPYFADSLVVSFTSITGETRPLVLNKDYYPTHYFLGASRACAAAIYGSITFFDLTLVGTLTLKYQTLGGQYTLNTSQITAILADQVHNPRETTWEQVTDQPGLFPPVDHAWNLTDLVGMSAVVDKLNSICDAIIANGASISQEHINNFENPHQTTAAQIGAVTKAELTVAVQQAVQQYGGGSSDQLTEGTKNLFFTQPRVEGTVLADYIAQASSTTVLTATDTVLSAFQKLSANFLAVNTALAGKVDAKAPVSKGLPAELLVSYTATTTSLAIDVSLTGSFNVLLKSTVAISFNTSFVTNATGNVVEFAVTTTNDSVGGYALAWPGNVKWAGGAIPPRTTAANGRDVWYFFSDDGMATWTGSLSNSDTR